MTAIFLISLTVLLVASAVLTADPVIALSSPITLRISGTAEFILSSPIVTVYSAVLSL